MYTRLALASPLLTLRLDTNDVRPQLLELYLPSCTTAFCTCLTVFCIYLTVFALELVLAFVFTRQFKVTEFGQDGLEVALRLLRPLLELLCHT